MRIQNKKLLIGWKIFTAVILLGLIFSSTIYAAPLPQGADPRPDNGGGGGGGAGGGSGAGGAGDPGGNGGGGGTSESACASLVGQMINWGFGGEGGVTTGLHAGSWQLTTVSASDGNYSFGGLGVGPAILHLSLSKEQSEHLQPLVQDAGVYLNCQFPIVANIALVKDPTVTPPATIKMSASRETLEAGQQTILDLTVRNGLPNDITNVVVTILLSPGLKVVDVTSKVDDNAIKIVDFDETRQLVAINLDKMAARTSQNLGVTLQAADELPAGVELKSTATLFYRESAAHQAVIKFSDGAADVPEPAPLPVEPTPAALPTPAAEALTPPTAEPASLPIPNPTPEPAQEAEALPAPTEEAEDFVPPSDMPKTGGDFISPPDKLPVTGEQPAVVTQKPASLNLNPFFPVAGLALAGIIFGLHSWHTSRRNKSQN